MKNEAMVFSDFLSIGALLVRARGFEPARTDGASFLVVVAAAAAAAARDALGSSAGGGGSGSGSASRRVSPLSSMAEHLCAGRHEQARGRG